MIGQAEVAHCSVPSAFSMALCEWTSPRASWSKRATGPLRSTSKPSQMLLNDRPVFFQLRGVPMANSMKRLAVAWWGAFSWRSSQRKSSTKTKPQIEDCRGTPHLLSQSGPSAICARWLIRLRWKGRPGSLLQVPGGTDGQLHHAVCLWMALRAIHFPISVTMVFWSLAWELRKSTVFFWATCQFFCRFSAELFPRNFLVSASGRSIQ